MTGWDPERFRLLSPADLDNLPEPTWLIDRVLPANSLCVLYREPGCGKTFVALSMALSIAAGHRWCGKPTEAGSVLYVAAEGLVGFKVRVKAYQIKHRIAAEQIRYLRVGFNLLDPSDVEAVLLSLESANFRPDLIILDTLARLISGDENTAQDMGLAIRAMDQLRCQTSATVLLVHHTGKSGKSERSSSPLRGAADVMIECTRGELTGLVSLKCDKMKDAERFPAATLGLERIPLDPASSSLAVTGWQDALEAGADQQRISKALEVLENEFGSNGATHGQWADRYIAAAKQSKSSFPRSCSPQGNRWGPPRRQKILPDAAGGWCQVSSSVRAVT